MFAVSRRALAVRVFLSVAGTFICSYGYHMTVGAGVGNGPLFAVQDGLFRHLQIPVGISAVVFGLGFAVLALLLGERIGLATFAVPVLTGLSIALLQPLAPTFHGLAMRWAMFGVGTSVMMFGAVLIVTAALGPSAIDAAMLALARASRRSVSHTRIGMEVTFALSGFAIGGRVGLGTIAMAISVGPLFVFWTRALEPVSMILRPASSVGEYCEADRPAGERLASDDGGIDHVECDSQSLAVAAGGGGHRRRQRRGGSVRTGADRPRSLHAVADRPHHVRKQRHSR